MEVPEGEMWETRDAKWCPFCNAKQMDVVETRIGSDEYTGMKRVTVVWRCPECSSRKR